MDPLVKPENDENWGRRQRDWREGTRELSGLQNHRIRKGRGKKREE